MFTIIHFNSIFDFIIFYAVIIIIVAIFAYYFYKKAAKSRKYYRCKSCGETYRTEYMNSLCCKVCGSTVEECNEQDIVDKSF